jgi:hypothetical protein
MYYAASSQLIPANGYDLAAITGGAIMNTTMINIPQSATFFHVFVTFVSKATVAIGGFRAIISLAGISLDGDEDEPKLVVLPLAIPIPVGWYIPIGH